jgi:hypothetical protein
MDVVSKGGSFWPVNYPESRFPPLFQRSRTLAEYTTCTTALQHLTAQMRNPARGGSWSLDELRR